MTYINQQEVGTLRGIPQTHTFVLVCVEISLEVSYKRHQVNLKTQASTRWIRRYWHYDQQYYDISIVGYVLKQLAK